MNRDELEVIEYKLRQIKLHMEDINAVITSIESTLLQTSGKNIINVDVDNSKSSTQPFDLSRLKNLKPGDFNTLTPPNISFNEMKNLEDK